MTKTNPPPNDSTNKKNNNKKNPKSKDVKDVKDGKEVKEELKTPKAMPPNTFIKFLESIDQKLGKYSPVNPTNILKPTDQKKEQPNNIELDIIENLDNLEIPESETSSELDPDYIPGLTASSSEVTTEGEEGEEADDEENEEDMDEQENIEEEEEEDVNKTLPASHEDFSNFLAKILFNSSEKKRTTGSGNPLLVLLGGNNGIGSDDNDESRKRPASISVTNDIKRQKMNSLDREYKAFLMNKEKDTYEHFCELDLESKKRIINEEKLVKELANDKEPIRLKVINSTLPPMIKGEIIRKLASSKCGFGSNAKLMDWVEHIMRVPWASYYPMPITLSDPSNKIGQYMTSIYNRMDMAVYGHDETKCHIMQIIGKWITNPSAVGNCLALQGPMGVGKTTLVKEGLAPALGRPFNFVSLGGATDASFLEGHSFTYEGSIPGQIVEVIQRSKCMNPIIYFDELDKISKSHRGEEIANLLIHITDTQQNDKFHDKYFGNIDIDLSKVFFVFSYNHDENVPAILKDRLQVVRVKGYNPTEKCKIAMEYMFPRFCKDMGFGTDELIINDEVINYMITSYADKEDGVRNLGRCLENLVSRLNVLRLVQNSNIEERDKFLAKLPFNAKKVPMITKNFLITREIIENILIKPKNDNQHHQHMYS
jgi:ATP-dependent Lon protease